MIDKFSIEELEQIKYWLRFWFNNCRKQADCYWLCPNKADNCLESYLKLYRLFDSLIKEGQNESI